MKLLLPHQYKKIGAIIAPLGFIFWLSMQKGLFTKLFSLIHEGNSAGSGNSQYQIANAVVAIISFFSFLGGMYFIAFSKEKIEDEMVQRTRLDSFQFAAFAQIVCMIMGFLSMLFLGEPNGDGGLVLFFLAAITLFWLCFIARFNYILHVKFRS